MLFGSGPGAMLFADDWAEWERPDGFCLWTMEYAAQLRGKPQWKEFFCHLQEQIICGPIQKNGMRRNAALLALVSNARAQSMTCLFTGLMTCAVTCHSDTHKWCGVSRTVSLTRVHSWLTQTTRSVAFGWTQEAHPRDGLNDGNEAYSGIPCHFCNYGMFWIEFAQSKSWYFSVSFISYRSRSFLKCLPYYL